MPHYMVFSIWNFPANFILPSIPCALLHTWRSSMHWFWIPSYVFFNTVLSPPLCFLMYWVKPPPVKFWGAPTPTNPPSYVLNICGKSWVGLGEWAFGGDVPHPRSRENPTKTLSQSHNELQNKNLLTFY